MTKLPASVIGQRLYLAYGSNLHVEQMALRCPSSKLIGKGTLPDYKWQINQRGYANIIPSKGHKVEGLLYAITEKDEKRLDASEGVAIGCYEKQELLVEVEGVRGNVLCDMECADLAKLLAVPIVEAPEDTRLGESERVGHPPDNVEEKETPRQTARVLVYVSSQFLKNGDIKEEYILRMQLAASDGLALGVSRSWIENTIHPFVYKQ